MCNCINDHKFKIKKEIDKMKKFEGVEIEIKIPSSKYLIGLDGTLRKTNSFEFLVEGTRHTDSGKKKGRVIKETFDFIFNYCPFCGENMNLNMEEFI